MRTYPFHFFQARTLQKICGKGAKSFDEGGPAPSVFVCCVRRGGRRSRARLLPRGAMASPKASGRKKPRLTSLLFACGLFVIAIGFGSVGKNIPLLLTRRPQTESRALLGLALAHSLELLCSRTSTGLWLASAALAAARGGKGLGLDLRDSRITL